MAIYLLHGFVGATSSWDAVRSAWPDEDLVGIALPGHPDGGPVATSWQANLERVAAALPRGAMAIGYSMGARVALGLLASEHLAAAVLIGVNPGFSQADAAARAARVTRDRGWAQLLRVQGIEAFVDAWEAQPMFASQAGVDPAARQRRRAHRLALDPEALARCLETMGTGAMPDYRAALAQRAARAHLIVGAEDDVYLGAARSLVTGVPRLGLDVIDGAGHDPTFEQPAALARAAEAAIARLRSAPAS